MKIYNKCKVLIKNINLEPLSFAIYLTLLIFIISYTNSNFSITQIVCFWGNGFWALTDFTLNIAMIFLFGFIIAESQLAKSLLITVLNKASNKHQAIFICCFITCISTLLNWSIGLVFGANACRFAMSKYKFINSKLLVASVYSSFILWHGGLSGTIPLMLSTPGHFLEHMVGGTIPTHLTIFSKFNVTIVLTILIGLPVFSYILSLLTDDSTISERDESSPILQKRKEKKFSFSIFSLSIICFFYLANAELNNLLLLDLNQVSFILFGLGLALHMDMQSYLNSALLGSSKIWGMIIQFPLYAGLMSIIMKTGLCEDISCFFIGKSTKETFPLYTFLSAGIVNFFIPSGGGQWVVQGPIVIKTAKELGISIEKISMIVAWGDAWTNLIQPFWAIPLLSIVNLSVKDILGYCFVMLLFTGTIIYFVILFS